MPRRAAFLVFAAVQAAAGAGAQSAAAPDSVPAAAPAPALHAWIPIGSLAEDRLRLEGLRGGRAEQGGYLLRSTSSLLTRRPGAQLALLTPRLEGIWNARIPHSLNDGPAWAGKGATGRLVFGVQAVAGPLRLVLAPEAVTEQNASFDALLPGWDSAQRGRFTLPWSAGRNSVDLPYRQGDQARTTVFAGESSVMLRAGVLEAGAATESQWWGPGIRNAILISDNAGGIPHLTLRSARPFRTPLGHLSARWIAGRMSPSRYDTVPPGTRTLSGAGLVLAPGGGLAVGVGRMVYAGAAEVTAGDALAVFHRWRGAGDTAVAHPYEQMTSLFARWTLPLDGVEVYGEWARRRLPTLREALEQPEHTQGYLLGGQWLRPAGSSLLRLQGEVTYLEKSATYRAGEVGSWYAGRAVPQGYTHHGQPLGASIGPGASSQWAAVDLVGDRWQGGLYMNRIRWANDAYYDQPGGPNRYRAHDVSMVGGVRASASLGGAWLTLQWTAGRRYNFLFQNRSLDFSQRHLSVSPFNHTVQLSLTPRIR